MNEINNKNDFSEREMKRIWIRSIISHFLLLKLLSRIPKFSLLTLRIFSRNSFGKCFGSLIFAPKNLCGNCGNGS